MPERIKIGLVQINTGFRWRRGRVPEKTISKSKASDNRNEPGQWEALPYSVGLLQAYAMKYAPSPERYDFLLPIYKRTPVKQAIEQLHGADVAGFSTYVWNLQLSLNIAQQLKNNKPGMLNVFGGPRIPNHPSKAEDFLRQYPFVDILCHGEGEPTFLAVLENSQERDWDGIPAISYLTADGAFMHHNMSTRIKNLSTIPSPYLEGVFDPLMRANPQENWMVLWETNRGCPFSCSFCDWGSAVHSGVYRFDMERLYKELDWMADHQIEGICGCDANFGMLERDLEIVHYTAKIKQERGFPQVLFQNNAKGNTKQSYAVQKALSDAGLCLLVTVSLQSTNPETLKNIKRTNISMDSFRELQQRYQRDGIATYTDMILALPGESYASFAGGISELLSHGQHNRVFFFNCLVLPNAEMGDPAYQDKYGILAVQQRAVDMHSSLQEEEVPEFLDTVIATKAMPKEDWVRAKIFWWMVELLHLGRLLQIPFVLLHELSGLTYQEMIEVISEADASKFPLLAWIHTLFLEKARAIQTGDPDFIPSEKHLGIWWPMPQYALITLVAEGNFEAFYDEVETLLVDYLHARSIALDSSLLSQAIKLNRQLIRVPFQIQNLEIELTYNVWEIYRGVLTGTSVELESGEHGYRIIRTRPAWFSWEDWCRHVTLCHWARDLYWYPIRSLRSTTGI